jgi:hypothetical protein
VRAGLHRCPRPGCKVIVPDGQLACREDWNRLSKPVRDEIWGTVRLNILHPRRYAALVAALDEWKS